MSNDYSADPHNSIAGAILTAEEVSDPLENLVENTAADPGAPFAPAALEGLAKLKTSDPAAFETMRGQLKKAGCRVTVLDEAIVSQNGERNGRDPTQSDILVDLAGVADLFHTPDGTSYADINIDDHRETWPVRSKGFKLWLVRSFFEATGGAPNSDALQSALNVIAARAHFDGPEREVSVRVGGLDDRLYLDLCDQTWRAVEIDAAGWRVIDNPPVRFRRAAGMKPLPIPVTGGSIATLRSLLNVKSDVDFVLVVAWALAVLRNRGPYPILGISGEQGAAKSTFSAMLRALLDPNTAPLRALPREDRDLFIAATNGHVLAFDNVSSLSGWISDTLCRLATGGGFAVRKLHTDQDEVLFEAARPIILNGIEDVVTRPDLADRALLVTLEPIAEERRRPEAEIWAAFEAERPGILGGLLDAVAHGLKRWPEIRLERLPRMADFALWASACETAIWPAATFMSAYRGNRDEAVESTIEANPVADAVRALIADRQEWTGTATDLRQILAQYVDEDVHTSKDWPRNAQALGGRLRRVATTLREIGINISFGRKGQGRTRAIHIAATLNCLTPENEGKVASAPSAPSLPELESSPANASVAPPMRTVGIDADESGGGGASTVSPKPLSTLETDDADGADAKNPQDADQQENCTTTWRARI
jgi:hypothetical protein